MMRTERLLLLRQKRAAAAAAAPAAPAAAAEVPRRARRRGLVAAALVLAGAGTGPAVASIRLPEGPFETGGEQQQGRSTSSSASLFAEKKDGSKSQSQQQQQQPSASPTRQTVRPTGVPKKWASPPPKVWNDEAAVPGLAVEIYDPYRTIEGPAADASIRAGMGRQVANIIACADLGEALRDWRGSFLWWRDMDLARKTMQWSFPEQKDVDRFSILLAECAVTPPAASADGKQPFGGVGGGGDMRDADDETKDFYHGDIIKRWLVGTKWPLPECPSEYRRGVIDPPKGSLFRGTDIRNRCAQLIETETTPRPVVEIAKMVCRAADYLAAGGRTKYHEWTVEILSKDPAAKATLDAVIEKQQTAGKPYHLALEKALEAYSSQLLRAEATARARGTFSDADRHPASVHEWFLQKMRNAAFFPDHEDRKTLLNILPAIQKAAADATPAGAAPRRHSGSSATTTTTTTPP